MGERSGTYGLRGTEDFRDRPAHNPDRRTPRLPSITRTVADSPPPLARRHLFAPRIAGTISPRLKEHSRGGTRSHNRRGSPKTGFHTRPRAFFDPLEPCLQRGGCCIVGQECLEVGALVSAQRDSDAHRKRGGTHRAARKRLRSARRPVPRPASPTEATSSNNRAPQTKGTLPLWVR